MSQRYLIPTNLFYHWRDPWPPEFPQPNTGDIYFNVSSQTLRVFYENEWHDAGGGGGGTGGSDEVAIQDAEPTLNTLELWVDTGTEGFLASHNDLTDLNADAHPQYLKAQKLIVSTFPASGPPAGGVDTVWIEF